MSSLKWRPSRNKIVTTVVYVMLILCRECQSCLWWGVLDTTLCNKVCQWLAAGQRYSGFLHQESWLPQYSWNIVKSGVKYPNPWNFFSYSFKLITRKLWYAPLYIKGLAWPWSYGMYNQCLLLSPLRLWVWHPLRQGVLDTTLCDKVCQLLATGWWFILDTSVSSTKRPDSLDIAKILLKVVIITMKPTNHFI